MKKIIGLYMFIMICIFIGCNKVNAYLSFKVGDTVSYNNMNFYVIKDNDKDDSTLTLIKALPIESSDIKEYNYLVK